MTPSETPIRDCSLDIPIIDTGFACIVDRESVILAAVISSYFSERGSYFPLFTFPGVTKSRLNDDATRDHDDFVPHMIGVQAATEIKNVIAEMGGCKVLILAGLSAAQRSYIDIASGVDCVEVPLVDDVDGALSQFGLTKAETLRCRPHEVLRGLNLAQNRGRRLWIADDAELLPPNELKGNGLVLVEHTPHTATCVAAANFAHSIAAAMLVATPLPKLAESGIARTIQRWRNESSDSARDELIAQITVRLGDVDLTRFDFATFFTEGLPYALVVNCAIPSSHIHLGLSPDRLIVNAITRERSGRRLASAVVFAIEDFKDVDESQWLTDFLRSNNYAVKVVAGKAATVESFDFHTTDYPYDLFHISSHGGEVEGSLVTVEFAARDGEHHVVEYDEVVGIAPTYDGSGLFSVQQKAMFRTLDGLDWGSAALAERNLGDGVYNDATRAMFDNINVIKRDRGDERRVPGSCVVVCSDGSHQAMFRSLAAYGQPIVFNNTCSSWLGVSHFFLASGAIAYIGTLWDVPLGLATNAAKTFYEHAKEGSLMNAVHAVNLSIEGTKHANIYALWGLPFSTFTIGNDEQDSLSRVASKMARHIEMLARHLEAPLSDEVRRSGTRGLRRVLDEFDRQFRGPAVDHLMAMARETLDRRGLGDPQDGA